MVFLSRFSEIFVVLLKIFFLVERKYFHGAKNIFAYSLGDLLSSRSITQSAYFTITTKFTSNSLLRLLIGAATNMTNCREQKPLRILVVFSQFSVVFS